MIKALVKTKETSFTTDLWRQKALPWKRCDDLCLYVVLLFPRNESLIVRTSATDYERQFPVDPKHAPPLSNEKKRKTASKRNSFTSNIWLQSVDAVFVTFRTTNLRPQMFEITLIKNRPGKAVAYSNMITDAHLKIPLSFCFTACVLVRSKKKAELLRVRNVTLDSLPNTGDTSNIASTNGHASTHVRTF